MYEIEVDNADTFIRKKRCGIRFNPHICVYENPFIDLIISYLISWHIIMNDKDDLDVIRRKQG